MMLAHNKVRNAMLVRLLREYGAVKGIRTGLDPANARDQIQGNLGDFGVAKAMGIVFLKSHGQWQRGWSQQAA